MRGDLSLFTHYLIQALRGGAAVRGDGLIHVLDIFHYVNEGVQKEQPGQVPVLKVKDLDLNFPIALDRGGKSIGLVHSPPTVVSIREQIIRNTAKVAIVTLSGSPREVSCGVNLAKGLVSAQRFFAGVTPYREIRGRPAQNDNLPIASFAPLRLFTILLTEPGL